MIFYERQIFLNSKYGRKSVDLIVEFSMKCKYSVGLIELE